MRMANNDKRFQETFTLDWTDHNMATHIWVTVGIEKAFRASRILGYTTSSMRLIESYRGVMECFVLV